jgi:CHAT domain-containing protein
LKQEINNTEFRNDEEEYDMRLSLLNTTIEWENVRKSLNKYDNPTISFSDLSSSISVDSIQNHLLGKQDLLLEFFQTSDTIYTIAINKSMVNIIRIAKNPNLNEHLQQYISHLFYKENYSSKKDFINFVTAAQYLYKSILEPVLSKLDNDYTEKITRLIIIPDIQFSNVPFEAFISEPADTSYINYFGLNYLCKDFTFDYAYAINLLNNKSKENNHEKDGILAMSYSSSNERNSLAYRDDEFGELPYSAVELRNIRKWISNGIFLDSDAATESVFKSRASNYDIIHLALHGIGDTLDMLNSHLVFKSPGNEIEDGMLYAHELYGMDLSGTELAVLSACETGVGKTMQGEGVYSLARGFAFAGCPSIVMSLWKVDDVSTSELMNYFYENLSRGMQKDVALQQAKIAFLQHTDDLGAHPANWAAFISLGNNDPVQIRGTTMKWYYWMIMIIVIGVSLLLYRHFRSNRLKQI